MDHALKWSSDEDNGGFGPRATFVVFGAVGRTGVGGGGGGGFDVGRKRLWSEPQRSSPDDYERAYGGGGGGDDDGESYDDSSKAALRVANVTEQDAGAYRCRVDFRDSPTRNYRIILRVIGECLGRARSASNVVSHVEPHSRPDPRPNLSTVRRNVTE